MSTGLIILIAVVALMVFFMSFMIIKSRRALQNKGENLNWLADYPELRPGSETGSPWYLVVTTRVCPNCKNLKNVLNDSGVIYREIDAAEYPELVQKLKVFAVPTTMVISGEQVSDVKVGVFKP